MKMDYTQVIEDFKNTQEFKDFLNAAGGCIISSPKQISNGTLIIGNDQKGKAWLISSAGYVREGSLIGVGRRKTIQAESNILRRRMDNPVVDINLYLSGLDVIYNAWKKRQQLMNSRIDKMNKNEKIQMLVITWLFDRSKIQSKNYDGNWVNHKLYYGPEDWDWGKIVETFGSPRILKNYRIST